MKGTETQIELAEKMMKQMNERFADMLNACPEEKKEECAVVIEKYNKIMNEAYAGDVISLLANNKTTDYIKFYHTLYTDMRITGGALSERLMHEIYRKLC